MYVCMYVRVCMCVCVCVCVSMYVMDLKETNYYYYKRWRTNVFLIFRDDEIDIGDSVAGSQSLVSSTNSVSVITSATTATAASGLAMITVSPSVSVPVATPAQEPVAGPSHTYSPWSFYSTRQRPHPPAK